jgi:hydrogenase maturation protease
MGDAASYLVIGLGNEFRCDDGCGPLVARLINQEHCPGVRVMQPLVDGTGMVMEWNGVDVAFVIDSVRSGAAPGKVYRFEPLVETVPERVFQPTSTHRLSITQIVRLAQALRRLPQRLIVYGIEGTNFAHGTDMTSAVVQAARHVAERIASEVSQFAALTCPGGESQP